MSNVCSQPTPRLGHPDPMAKIPGASDLRGHETLDDFVRIIMLRENSKAKRDSLPPLTPSEKTGTAAPSFLRRVTHNLFGI